MNIIDKIKNALSVNKLITQEDILKIRKADWDTCVKCWHILNSWGWPEELLPEEAPTKTWKPETRRQYLMQVIDKKVGEKYILRILNTQRGMTEEEFEDFWAGSHDGDKEALERYYSRLEYNIKPK